jgi:hypothetical protein
MGQLRHAGRGGEMINAYPFVVDKVRGKDRLEGLGVDGMLILNGSYGNGVGSYGLDSSGTR